MGQVYRARDTKLNRDVALKVLPESFADDPDRLARFTREAQVLASLNHPNVVTVYDVWEEQEHHWLSMEYMERGNLEERVLERGPQSLRVYLRLIRRSVVSVTYDTEHDVRYSRRSSAFASSRSISTRIAEANGSDRGFLWRLNSYWRYRQVGDAVRIDVLSLSLSRDVPWILKPVADPIVRSIGRDSMSRTLATVAQAAVATRPTGIRNAPATAR